MESQAEIDDGGFPPMSMRAPYADKAILPPKPLPQVANLVREAPSSRKRKVKLNDAQTAVVAVIVVVLLVVAARKVFARK